MYPKGTSAHASNLNANGAEGVKGGEGEDRVRAEKRLPYECSNLGMGIRGKGQVTLGDVRFP